MSAEGSRLKRRTPASTGRSRHWLWPAAIAALLALAAWQGHRIAGALPRIEETVQQLGPWGPLALAGAILVLAPLAVPDSIFGLVAGFAFGLVQGTAVYYGAVVAANLLVVLASRRWLRARVLHFLATRPQLDRIRRAASTGGLKLSFLVRLIPFQPSVVSYVLGASDLRLRDIAVGMLGLLPHMFLTVWAGHAAQRVTRLAGGGHRGWNVEDTVVVGCLVLVLALMERTVRSIRAELERLEVESSGAVEGEG